MKRPGSAPLAGALALLAVASMTLGLGDGGEPRCQEAAHRDRGENSYRDIVGTFTLQGLTDGPLQRDSGTFLTSPNASAPSRVVDGQRTQHFGVNDTLTGKRGTLVIQSFGDGVSAGGGYDVGSGTWSIVRGTGAYAGLKGGGRFGYAMTPTKFSFAQFEGFVQAQ